MEKPLKLYQFDVIPNKIHFSSFCGSRQAALIVYMEQQRVMNN